MPGSPVLIALDALKVILDKLEFAVGD